MSKNLDTQKIKFACERNEDYVFISYSHQDAKLVMHDIELMYKKGVRLWYDDGLHAGENWKKIITQVLEDIHCKFVLFYLSPHTFSSNAIFFEITETIRVFKNVKNCTGEFFASINLDGKSVLQILDETSQRLSREEMATRTQEKVVGILNFFNENITYFSRSSEIEDDTHIPKIIQRLQKFNCVSGLIYRGLKIKEVQDNAYEIVEYLDDDTTIEIPEMIFGKPIIGVSSAVFAGKRIRMIQILANLKYIGARAFAYCENLQEIQFPDSLEIIGEKAFYNCILLKSVKFSVNLKEMGEMAFLGCQRLEFIKDDSLKTCENLAVLKAGTFSGTNLKKIILPDKLKHLEFSKSPNENARIFSGNKSKVICSSKSVFKEIVNLFNMYYSIASKINTIFVFPISYKDELSDLNQRIISDHFFWKLPPITNIRYDEKTERIIWEYSIGAEHLYEMQIDGQTCYIGHDKCIKYKKEGNGVKHIKLRVLGNMKDHTYSSDYSETLYIDTTKTEDFIFDQNGKIQKYQGQSDVLILSKELANCINFTQSFFSNDNLIYIGIEEGCEAIRLENGAIYSSDYSVLIAYPGKNTAKVFKVNEKTSMIMNNAFMGAKYLEEIILPPKIQNIGEKAFIECVNLKTIKNMESTKLRELNCETFFECKKLTEIILPKSIVSIGQECFSGCEKLTDKSFAFIEQLEFVGVKAFANCTSLVYIDYISRLKIINNGIFSGCRGIKKVELGKHCETIQANAFYKCESLQEIILPECLQEINNYVFYSCKSLSHIIIPDSVKIILYNAFSGCDMLKDIVISYNSKLTKIDEYAFNDCFALSEIRIPKNVSYIGRYAFKNCKNLQKIIFEGNEIKNFEEGLFYGCKNLLKFNVPENVTDIGDFTFAKCHRLKQIKIPSSVTRIGSNVFIDCIELKDIFIHKDNSHYKFRQTELYEADVNKIEQIHWSVFKEEKLSLSACRIGDCAYRSHSTIKELILKDDVESIGISAFKDCENLFKLTIENQMTLLGIAAFQGCKALQQIQLPPYKHLSESIFSGCSNLNTIVLPEGVESIGDCVFQDCGSLKNCTFPNTVKIIGAGVFYNCLQLKELRLNTGLQEIGSFAFKNCTSLVNVDLPYTVEKIGQACFENCEKIEKVKISTNIHIIPSKMFYNCKKLQEIDMPDNLYEVQDYAFFGCSSLEEIHLPSSVHKIAKNAFKGCNPKIKIYLCQETSLKIDLFDYPEVEFELDDK